MKKPKIKDVKVGMIFKVSGIPCRVTKRPFFDKRGDRPNIFYAIFVNPKNFRKKRLDSDRDFAVWDYMYTGVNWKRIK